MSNSVKPGIKPMTILKVVLVIIVVVVAIIIWDMPSRRGGGTVGDKGGWQGPCRWPATASGHGRWLPAQSAQEERRRSEWGRRTSASRIVHAGTCVGRPTSRCSRPAQAAGG